MKRRFALFLGFASLCSSASAQDAEKTLPAPEVAPAPQKVEPVPVAVDPTPVIVEPVDFWNAAPPTVVAGVGVELLQWWYKPDRIPSLLNTGRESANAADALIAGTANDPTARSLFGTNQYDYGTIPGIRANVFVAIAGPLDFELNGLLMESRVIDQFFTGERGRPLLVRPFYDARNLIESGYDVSAQRFDPMTGLPTGALSGSVRVMTENQLWGYEANLAYRVVQPESAIRRLLFGYRQISLNESLVVDETVAATRPDLIAFRGAPLGPNDSLFIVDDFSTRNMFFGPQIGAEWTWGLGPVSFDLLTKVAVGVNHQRYFVGGATSLVTAGVVADTTPGGLLAVATNSGSRTRDELTVVPELGVKLNFDVTQSIRVNVGYNLLYMSSVARPGAQIDNRGNPEFAPSDVSYNPNSPGPFLPRPFFRDTDFYAHGLSFGLVLAY